MAPIMLEMGLRPCKVKIYEADKKHPGYFVNVGAKNALFHCWSQESDVVAPSPMVGGHAGGVVSHTYGIVEFESGKVAKVTPSDITFLDNKHEEYAFPNEEEKEGKKKENDLQTESGD